MNRKTIDTIDTIGTPDISIRVLNAATAYCRANNLLGSQPHINSSVGLATAVSQLIAPDVYLAVLIVKPLLKLFSQENLPFLQGATRAEDKVADKAFDNIANRLVDNDASLNPKEVADFLKKLKEDLTKFGYYPCTPPAF